MFRDPGQKLIDNDLILWIQTESGIAVSLLEIGVACQVDAAPAYPATPTQTANNKHRAAAAAAAAAAAGVAAGEPNSNSMLQYGSSSATVPTTAATGSAASGLGMGVVGGGMGSMGGGMGMGMGMGVVGGMGMGMGGGMAPYSLHGSTMGSSCESSVERIPVDTIDALGPELAVATSQVLENLSENERKMIIEVLNRDESVRQRDATRMM
ncbi:keratin, type I cytoskeletal 13-like [Drosophila rhopaloa]|uniref:Uncharacterized protein n=1 Tax=Drosophila rhopaloa TaxID=1041015 RepID=A0ABM5J803_DRORH|nr:keratin, type I cytoskeletal 13-like [Drosophila rhopaloa]